MKINLPLKVTIKPDRKFYETYNRAVKKVIKKTTQNIKNEIPVDSGATQKELDYTINYDKGEAIIGWKKGSHEELVGNVLQFGSGQRGESSYRSSFGESKPSYTNPIISTRAKAMRFIDKNGDVRYMKSFAGHVPKYILTKGLQKSIKEMSRVFEMEFNK